MTVEGLSLTIGKLASAGGVNVETVRFYQRKGLLRVPAREHGFRRYDEKDLQRLRFIRKAQTASFTLNQIKDFLDLEAGGDHDRARELAMAHIPELDKRIRELKSMRTALRRLANASAGETASGLSVIDLLGS